MKLSIYSLVCFLTGFLIFTTGCERSVNTMPYNVWVIHSYEKDCPWMEEMNRGITDGFKVENVKVNLQIDYLNSQYSNQQCKDTVLAYMNSGKKPDLILTVNDQATVAVLNSGLLDEANGSLVVCCGISYPDSALLNGHGMSQVSGFTTRVNFEDALNLGKIIKRKNLYMPLTSHNIGSKASREIISQVEKFSNTVVDVKIDTISEQMSYHDMYYRISDGHFQTFGILPEWDPLAAKFISTSATPFIAINNEGFGQGVLGGYFTPSYNLAHDGARCAAKKLKREKVSSRMQESEKKLLIDWAVYHRFDFPFDRLPDNTEFINMPFSVRYKAQLQIAVIVSVFLFTVLLFVIIYKIKLYRKQKKENEHKLIQQRDNLLVITNSINEGIITIDKYGLIRSINFRAKQLLQLGENERDYLNTLFSDWVQIVDPAVSERTENIFDIVLNEKRSISFSPMTRMKCQKTGHYFLANGKLTPMIIKGKIKGSICVFSDRTDEFTTGEYLSLTTNVGQLFFWWFDFHKSCFLVDPTFFTNWGIEDDGTHTLPLDMFLSFINPLDIEDWHTFYDKLRFSQKDIRATREIRLNLNGENEQYWEVRMVYHLNGEDTLPILYGLCVNIQDYKDKQELLQEARDNVYRSEQLKSAFLSNMSHEIRTPLNGIIGFAKLIASNEEYEEEDYELFIDTIQSNCNLLLALINDILDLARIDSNSMVYTDTDCNLSSLIIQVMTTQQVILQKPLQLLRKLPAEPVYLMVDKLRLNQVITNLVNNAVKFTNEGSITIGYTSDDKNVYITVTDTGIGISAEEQVLIFERFYKKHDDIQGAGIGLNLCKNIVEHYNGSLSVSSATGKGTTFTVMLPLKNVNV